ncbi:hypothetical protein [Novosphingobium resinovorum]|uniref:hypothetical protein n=1 Tax=Novosphingobium resinovorum TaxID=158500 RepID=UPI002ED4423F|nr:hypothetical protein [Novosphingobium resinovorum]
MTAAFPWSLLGIAPTGDARAIRSAYAARIRTMDLDADVEGYAALRQARDAALRIAKSMAAEPGAANFGEQGEAPAAAAASPADSPAGTPPGTGVGTGAGTPVLGGDRHGDPALTTQLSPIADDAAVRFTPTDAGPAAEAEACGESLLPVHPNVLAAVRLEGHADSDAVGMEALQSPFARLAALLDPDGPQGTAPLDDAQDRQALAILNAVLDGVHWSPIDRQDEMENWLAGLLAQAWPRSAPLLEPATDAFGWEQEWGRLDARTPVEYLGARLRGYRFQRRVLEPSHRYHKAWLELARPGRAGPLRLLRANGGDVRGLLAGVRKNFPELEDHFDPQRVASWEEASGWPTGLIVGGGLMMLALLVAIADPGPASHSDSGANPAIFTPAGKASGDPAAEKRAVDEATAAAVAEVFGPDRDTAWLHRQQPELAIALELSTRAELQDGKGTGIAVERAVEKVRQRFYLDAGTLSGADFDQAMHLRLGLLEAARRHGTATCLTYLNAGVLAATVPVPDTLRTQERALAASLADRGLLIAPGLTGPRTASVPGPLVQDVMRATGLAHGAVAQAMQGKGSDANRCAVSIALLQATLRWKGEHRRDVLLLL